MDTKSRAPRNKYANQAVAFINNLHLNGDYHGERMKLRPWQETIIRRLFGTVDKDGRRLVRRLFLLLPRKSAKTFLAASVALVSLFCLGPNQVIVSAAASQKQASLIFDAMREIIQQDAFLRSLCEIMKGEKRIAVPCLNSYFVAGSSGGGTAHGHNPSIVILDELHAWTKKSHRETFAALTTGRGARREPLTIIISTQTNDHLSLAGIEFDYAKQLKGRIENGETVEDGTIENPAYLAALYYANPDDDWHDEKLWHRVSPALGDFLDIEEVRDQHRIAVEMPSFQQYFKTLYLNMPGDESERWMKMATWDACRAFAPPKYDASFREYEERLKQYEAELADKECWGGLDLAPVNDLSALTLIFQHEDRLRILPYFWCSAADIRERSLTEKVPYELWAKHKLITATSGSSTDFKVIERDIEALSKRFRIKSLATDKAHAFELGQALSNKGISVEWFQQGFISMGPPTARLQKLVLDKRIEHPANPVLDLCIRNVRCDVDAAGNMKPSNEKRLPHEKIDGAVSTIMAVGRWMPDQVEDKASIYSTQGITVF